MFRNIRLGLLGAAALGLPAFATAASITPAAYEDTIGVGDTVSVDKSITTDARGATQADVFFLADNTASMGGIINNAQSRASDILNADAFNGRNIGFGVGRYYGDPSETFVDANSAYDVLQPITTHKTNVQTAINNWNAIGGADIPEANLYALQQAATEGADGASGVGSGEATGWREGSQRIAAWFGDAPGHQETTELSESIDALNDAGVTVVAFNSESSGSGLDGRYTTTEATDGRDQASAIVDATGGLLTNDFTDKTSDEFVDAIVNSIDTATSTFDLLFGTRGDTSGLDIAFTCTDSAGCEDVPGGESRRFRLDITGTAPGSYDFSVFARGVDAFENDLITVTGSGGNGDGGGDSTTVAEPPITLLFGLGVLLLALSRRRIAHGGLR